jgi:TonB family protein
MRAFETWLLAYLLNSLWQVPLVFFAAWITARAVRRNGPRMEHRIWVSALALEALLPACSVQPVQLLREVWQFLPGIWGTNTAKAGVRVTVAFGEGAGHGALRLPVAMLAGVALVYAGSVVYFTGRLLWGWWRTDTIHDRAEPLVLAGEEAESWERSCRVFGVGDAEIRVSSDIAGPMTMGIFRRAILLPVDLQGHLFDEDFDAVIAHEFAHMHRRDFAKNLLYEALALPVAYHPLLWLTRTRMVGSREMVCDAMAAETVAGRENYARSLLRLASLLVHGTPARTLHAIGIFDANIFERRVMNLTEKYVELRGVRRLATVVACVVLGLGTCASALALRMNVSAPVAQSEAPSASGKTVRVSGSVMAGEILNKVQPVYPQEAKDAGIQGTVVLHAIIGKQGTMQSLTVISGPPELQTAALDAVKQWTYRPYLLNGEPTAVNTTIMINFSLAGSSAEPATAPSR